MEAALRLLDERWRVYQYLIKRTRDPFVAPPCAEPVAHEALARRAAYLNSRRAALHELDLFLVLLYEPPLRAKPRRAAPALGHGSRCGRRCPPARPATLLEAELDRAASTRCTRRPTGFEAQTRRTGPRAVVVRRGLPVLPPPRELRRRAARRDAADARRRTSTTSPPTRRWSATATTSRVGRQRVKVLTMKEAPAQTFAQRARRPD